MSSTRRTAPVNMKFLVTGISRTSMSEKSNEKDEQERQLREEYERLLRQLDRKPADSPPPRQPTPEKENSTRGR